MLMMTTLVCDVTAVLVRQWCWFRQYPPLFPPDITNPRVKGGLEGYFLGFGHSRHYYGSSLSRCACVDERTQASS